MRGENARRGAARPGNAWRIFWWILLIVYVCVIYGHSLTPADLSSQESGFVLRVCRGVLAGLGLESAWLTEHMVRKTAHFVEYAGLGVLLAVNFRPWKGAGRPAPCGFWTRIRGALELALAVPFVDETIQLFVEGRSGQISDVWLDMSGALCGLAAACLLGMGLKRRELP